MRFLKTLPHAELSIQLFQWNGKYIIKLEAGAYEQVYKVAELDIVSEEYLEKDILAKLAPQALNIFKTMKENMAQLLD